MSMRDTSCLVLLALPYPTLLRRAVKTVSSQTTSRISQKPLQQRKSITVYCSRSHIFFFTLDYFKGLISWQFSILSHQQVTSSTKYTLTPLKVGYDIAPVRSPNLPPCPLKNEYETIEYLGIKLRPESMFDTGSSMTFNRLQWYQVISVAISGYFIHMTEQRWEKKTHTTAAFNISLPTRKQI